MFSISLEQSRGPKVVSSGSRSGRLQTYFSLKLICELSERDYSVCLYIGGVCLYLFPEKIGKDHFFWSFGKYASEISHVMWRHQYDPIGRSVCGCKA